MIFPSCAFRYYPGLLNYKITEKGNRMLLFKSIILALLLIAIKSNLVPQTNCLIHSQKKLFVLLDLKSDEPYWIQTSDNGLIFYNFCDAFQVPQCNYNDQYLAYLIKGEDRDCFPLTSGRSGNFEVQYGYDNYLEENVLSLYYIQDKINQYNYQLNIKLICSEVQFSVDNYQIRQDLIILIIRSIHGCPVYEIPPLLRLIDSYELLITVFLVLVGFLFLFYGRVMLNLTAFLSISTTLVIILTFVSFRFMEQSVSESYLYLTISIIITASFAIAYFITKHFIKAALFFIGSLFGFFAVTFIKAFVLAYLATQVQLLYFANGIMVFVTIVAMLLLGSFTLEHKQNVIICSTAISGSYMMIRGFSLIFGGFPSQYQLMDRVQARQISSIPLSFFFYLLLILLLASIGGIYQQTKLKKQRKSEYAESQRTSGISERVSSYIQANLDQIHNQIDRLIDRYQTSSNYVSPPHDTEQPQAQQLTNYHKMQEKQTS